MGRHIQTNGQGDGFITDWANFTVTTYQGGRQTERYEFDTNDEFCAFLEAHPEYDPRVQLDAYRKWKQEKSGC